MSREPAQHSRLHSSGPLAMIWSRSTADITALVDAVGSERAALALHDNAIAWYRPQEAQHEAER